MERVGAWNAGIIGYFTGGRTVTNLDGLVNDEVVPHIVGNTLDSYVLKRELRYLCDFRAMVRWGPLQRRGGYADGALSQRSCLLVDLGHPDDEERHLSIFRLVQPGQQCTPPRDN
jgi:hypothetical protein